MLVAERELGLYSYQKRMRYLLDRQMFRWLAIIISFVTSNGAWAAPEPSANDSAKRQFAQLERTLDGGRLGVFAWDTGSGAQVGYRENERFHFQSTFKTFLAAMVLKQTSEKPGLLRQRVHYSQSDIVFHSPVTEKHVHDGMTVSELLSAMLTQSDNTATNLLMKRVGGPATVTAFVRSLGNHEFRLESWEPNLSSTPGDLRDTSTPTAIGRTLERVVLGDALSASQRKLLRKGLVGNMVAPACIRAGVPADWKVGDRSGGGEYGVRNDIAVLWPPQKAPIILAIFTTRSTKDAPPKDDVIAAATRIVVNWAAAQH